MSDTLTLTGARTLADRVIAAAVEAGVAISDVVVDPRGPTS